MALPQEKLPAFAVEAYLAWEAQQATRSEYVRGEVFAMPATEDRHLTAAGNLAMALREALRGSPCRVYMSQLKLRVDAADAFFYPDVFVTCSAADLADRLVKREAVLVAEVLSDSTAAYDRGGKKCCSWTCANGPSTCSAAARTACGCCTRCRPATR